MVKTKIFVEGGGKRATMNQECRRGFVKFLTKAGVSANAFEVEACGPRGDAYNRFSAECRRRLPSLLLVDAEVPVTSPSTWQHLKDNDRWSRPEGARDDGCHLMVQAMESWFLADTNVLKSFYGQGFRAQSLPKNPNIERVPKQDVISKLKKASCDTGKGGYDKGRDSFKILEKIDPSKVMKASPHANRLIRSLSGK